MIRRKIPLFKLASSLSQPIWIQSYLDGNGNFNYAIHFTDNLDDTILKNSNHSMVLW